jgi:hypothetical protein
MGTSFREVDSQEFLREDRKEKNDFLCIIQYGHNSIINIIKNHDLSFEINPSVFPSLSTSIIVDVDIQRFPNPPRRITLQLPSQQTDHRATKPPHLPASPVAQRCHLSFAPGQTNKNLYQNHLPHERLRRT